MSRQAEKPLYWDNHEAFRRLLIMGGASLVIGVFYGEQASDGLFVSWMGSWLPVVMWGSGLLILAMCFLLHPKQYSVYPDRYVVEWWHFRRKVIPFDEITKLKVWSNMGKKQLAIISSGPNGEFGWECISPRKTLPFAERLEEALNRHRFLAGRPHYHRERRHQRQKEGLKANGVSGWREAAARTAPHLWQPGAGIRRSGPAIAGLRWPVGR